MTVSGAPLNGSFERFGGGAHHLACFVLDDGCDSCGDSKPPLVI